LTLFKTLENDWQACVRHKENIRVSAITIHFHCFDRLQAAPLLYGLVHLPALLLEAELEGGHFWTAVPGAASAHAGHHAAAEGLAEGPCQFVQLQLVLVERHRINYRPVIMH
jgi:hypothetical protein